MICSPCKSCSKQKLPKDTCMKTCEKIKEVQEILISREEEVLTHTIDYLEENILVNG